MGLKPLPCEERLSGQGWFSQGKGHLGGHPAASLALVGRNGGDKVRLFTAVCGRRARGSSPS